MNLVTAVENVFKTDCWPEFRRLLSSPFQWSQQLTRHQLLEAQIRTNGKCCILPK